MEEWTQEQTEVGAQRLNKQTKTKQLYFNKQNKRAGMAT